jgi:DNA-binding CsgD family transcriptional regulator
MILRLAEVEYRAGRWSIAARLANDALEIAVETGRSNFAGEILSLRAGIAAAMGHADRAREDGLESLSVCERLGDRWFELHARWALGFLELSLGDHDACHTWLEPLVRLTEEMGLEEPGAIPFVPDEVEALVALGELEAATRLTDRLERQGRALDRPLALATAARCRGLIMGASRELGLAEEHLARALSEHARVQQPFERARTLLIAGTIHRRNRKKRSARELLQEALESFEELGASLWASKARAELARIGGRAVVVGELTDTERAVASLAAEGSTNKEIADRLFISVKTVEANLSRVFSKLHVGSRRELRNALEPLEGGEQT